jgi:NADH-quinone oxidoreductase subunit N
LGQKEPLMAAMMAIFMLSLGGLPLTGGFIGKWFLFGGLMQRGKEEGKHWYYWLALWGVLNTVVSFYYYVRFIRVMYLDDRAAEERPLSLSPALQVALGVAVIGVVLIGVYPQPFINLAQSVVSTLAGGAVALK